ncbi:hypothetical protein FJT64_010880 [Amphibalanus amphitrite]|uniref:Gustatory receptor n=1 Tax=Amphibalanus amphitrite TaxID=1232801 RepID=A0A6A4VNR6_AMPAM|nr:hypothetical protein FJT64_010880 [Amphibalanus amphitrite]
MSAGLVALFDVLLVGLMDVTAVLLIRLGRFAAELGRPDGDGGGIRSAGEPDSVLPEPEDTSPAAGTVIHVRQQSGEPPAPTKRGPFVLASAESSPPTAYTRAESAPAPLQRAAYPESRLRLLSATLSEVTQLAEDSADLCSLPTLSLHTAATTGLLAGIYCFIQLVHIFFSTAAQVSESVMFLLFLASFAVRLVAIGAAGSRLSGQQQRLRARLSAVRWSPPAPPAVHSELHLLLEQTRQELVFHGWGLFSTQKETIVSLLGFVLTYVVILVQMNVS